MFFLTGMMGSGKTFFGKKLAEAFSVPHFDTDDVVVLTAKQSINDLFKNMGSDAFRRLEKQALEFVCENNPDAIVSTGGGIILDYDNVQKMKKHGKIIFLNRSVQDILNDIDISQRPLLKQDKSKLFEIYNQRINLYKKYADFEVMSKARQETFLQLLDFIKNGRLKKICV
jgi:shikimate kinase